MPRKKQTAPAVEGQVDATPEKKVKAPREKKEKAPAQLGGIKRTELSGSMVTAHLLVASVYSKQTNYHPDIDNIQLLPDNRVAVVVALGDLPYNYSQVGFVQIQTPEDGPSILVDTFYTQDLTGVYQVPNSPLISRDEYLNS